MSIILVLYNTAEHSRLARVRGCSTLGLTRQSTSTPHFVRIACSRLSSAKALEEFGRSKSLNQSVWVATPRLLFQRLIPGQDGSDLHDPTC